MAGLGDKVKDEITGLEGVVLARMDALFETTQCRVHPTTLTESGDPRSSHWIEEDRLIVVKEHAVVGFKNVAGRAEGKV